MTIKACVLFWLLAGSATSKIFNFGKVSFFQIIVANDMITFPVLSFKNRLHLISRIRNLLFNFKGYEFKIIFYDCNLGPTLCVTFL